MACMYVLHILRSHITQGGSSTLMLAAYLDKTDIVAELVKAGANMDLQNKVVRILCVFICYFSMSYCRIFRVHNTS